MDCKSVPIRASGSIPLSPTIAVDTGRIGERRPLQSGNPEGRCAAEQPEGLEVRIFLSAVNILL